MAVSFELPSGRPALMGVLNVTPDSFSDGGIYDSAEAAIEAGRRMLEEGADLVDVGGESTRPGAEPVDEEEEIERVLPVVQGLAHDGVPVSIDTMKPRVAELALAAGAFLVNDVNGLRTEGMLDVVARAQCHVCVMHMLGEPRNMQVDPKYDDVVLAVGGFLADRVSALARAGLDRDRIWIDPGIGFGKSVEHNLKLIAKLESFVSIGVPVVIGVSRKSFLGKLTGGALVHDRLEATLAAQVVAQINGARVIRAHNVRSSRRAIDVTAALMSV